MTFSTAHESPQFRSLIIPFLQLHLTALGCGTVLGWAGGGSVGAFLSAALVSAALSGLWFRSEHQVITDLKAKMADEPETLLMLSQLSKTFDCPPPRLWVLEVPEVWAIACRSLGSSGALLVSRGALLSCSDQQLRALFSEGLGRISGLGIVFQTLCARLSHQFMSWAPKKIKEIVYTTPQSSATVTHLTTASFRPRDWYLFLMLDRLSHWIEKMGHSGSLVGSTPGVRLLVLNAPGDISNLQEGVLFRDTKRV